MARGGAGCRLSRQQSGAARSVLPAGRAEVGRVVERPSEDSWEVRLVRLIRLRHLSYRTEQAYLGWCRRLARRFRGRNLEGLTDEEGHTSVETTQIYTHVMQKPGLGVRSPLDV